MSPLQRFRIAIVLIAVVILGGTAGYSIIENRSFLDSLYMSIITISTVGFKEVWELSKSGRIFTICLILSSISVATYGLTVISSFIIEGHFRQIGRRRRMETKINRIRGHYIVCGEGIVAEQVVEELKKAKVPFIIVCRDYKSFEENLERSELKRSEELLYVEGDPTNDEVLKKAKVQDAKGLIACLASDTDNLFVTLSARSLNPRLKIVAQAREEVSQGKMLKAGADNVISPEVIGGRRMASIILRPTVVSFLDIMTRGEKDVTLRLEEVKIPKGSPLVGKSISEAEIRRQTGTLVVAIKDKKTDTIVYTPPPSSVLKEGDILLVLGEEEGISKLYKLCRVE